MAPHGGVLCLGNIVLDLLVRPVDRLEWNTTVWVDSLARQLGGNGANTAYALARLGTPVRLVSMVGRDAAGEDALARLESAGVDVREVGRAEAPTAATIVIVNSAGDRLFLHRPGVSAEAFPEPLEISPRLVDGMAHLHVGNPFALVQVRRHAAETLRRARAAGLTTSVDAGWDAEGRWLADFAAYLPETDLLFVNAEEARRLANTADAAQAARDLRRLGAGTVVVKMGAGGCAVYGHDSEFRSPAFAVPAVDTTGAGDCFAGAWLAAAWRGLGAWECARFANAAAALSIQHLGATEGLRSWEETERWMREHGQQFSNPDMTVKSEIDSSARRA